MSKMIEQLSSGGCQIKRKKCEPRKECEESNVGYGREDPGSHC